MRAVGKVSRRAATAGRVWTTSPIEPRRTIKKRSEEASAILGLSDASEKLTRGVALGVADDCDANAEARGDLTLGNRVGSVVGAFGVDVGAKRFEKRPDGEIVEEENEIHRGKCSNQLGACSSRKNGAARAFEGANAGIGVDGDDEEITLAAGAFEIADVADVKEVEAAVGEHDATALSALVIEAARGGVE